MWYFWYRFLYRFLYALIRLFCHMGFSTSIQPYLFTKVSNKVFLDFQHLREIDSNVQNHHRSTRKVDALDRNLGKIFGQKSGELSCDTIWSPNRSHAPNLSPSANRCKQRVWENSKLIPHAHENQDVACHKRRPIKTLIFYTELRK